MPKKITTESFIEKAKKVHDDKYDYSKVEYVNNRTKVCIICPKHGEFWQTPNNHLSGKGCPKCNGGTKKDTKWFVEKAKEVHGDKYDYSEVIYVDAFTKVCIICPIHGEFWQSPTNHIHKTHPRGCPKCNGGLKTTKDGFIEKARQIHGDKYDYSKVEYINANTKVCIICPKHGEFWQIPNAHLHGNRCSKCWEEIKPLTLLKNKEKFIEKARKIHGDKYDYSKVDYVNSSTDVIITCPTHGDFLQNPNHHLRGQGCKECGKIAISLKKRMTIDEFVRRAKEIHGDKYEYAKTELNNRDEKGRVIITCPIHGEFWQTPNNHLHGKGCEKCVRPIYNTESFVAAAREIHGDRYDYSNTNYVNSNTKVSIVCPIHGEFRVLPGNHIRYKHGCGKCNRSHLEEEIASFLDDNNIVYEDEKTFDWLGKQELDFYLPKYNIAIECQGIQHFEEREFFADSLEMIQTRDERKHKLCEEHGLKLLYYSNLGIDYPYKVFEDKEVLLKEIKNL